MNVEITREAFIQLTKDECEQVKILKIEEHEHYRRETWKVWGVYLFVIENYLSSVTQYYIQDINA